MAARSAAPPRTLATASLRSCSAGTWISRAAWGRSAGCTARPGRCRRRPWRPARGRGAGLGVDAVRRPRIGGGGGCRDELGVQQVHRPEAARDAGRAGVGVPARLQVGHAHEDTAGHVELARGVREGVLQPSVGRIGAAGHREDQQRWQQRRPRDHTGRTAASPDGTGDTSNDRSSHCRGSPNHARSQLGQRSCPSRHPLYVSVPRAPCRGERHRCGPALPQRPPGRRQSLRCPGQPNMTCRPVPARPPGRPDAQSSTGSTCQSGCPGIGGVCAPYSHGLRNGPRSSPATRDASAMKSRVPAARPR